jgi:hypothetical protein
VPAGRDPRRPDEFSQTFANTDGSRTPEQSVEPQRVRQNGARVPLDTSLRRTAAGVSPKAPVLLMTFSGGGDRLVGVLTDPRTEYPVYIDPSVSGSMSGGAWTSVWSKYPTKSFWKNTTALTDGSITGQAGAGRTGPAEAEAVTDVLRGGRHRPVWRRVPSVGAVRNIVRSMIPALLGIVLLTVPACDNGDPPELVAVPGARWQGFAKGCPVFDGEEPGKRPAPAYDGPALFSVRCQYKVAGTRELKIALSVTVYRAASGGGTVEQLAADTMMRDQGSAEDTEALAGLGDSAFTRLVPGRGVRVYVRSGNALVELDYTDPGDGRAALATATGLTRQALTGLL